MHFVPKSVVVLCAFAFLAGCGPQFGRPDGPLERLAGAKLDPALWKLGSRAYEPFKFEILEFVRKNDDINHWRELVTLETYTPEVMPGSLEDAFNRKKAHRAAICPGTAQLAVISKSADSLVYEDVHGPCRGFGPEHEVGKILIGARTRFVLRYTGKGTAWEPGEREKWLDFLSAAKIAPR